MSRAGCGRGSSLTFGKNPCAAMILNQGRVFSQLPGISESRVVARLARRSGCLEEIALSSVARGFLSVRRPTTVGFGSRDSGALRDDGSRAVTAAVSRTSAQLLSHVLPAVAAFRFDAPDWFIPMTIIRRIRIPGTPNKAPEPTTFAVTARAIERLLEMNQQNPNRHVARAAPAKVVAHL